MKPDKTDYIGVGRIAGVFGHDGWLKIMVHSQNKDRFQNVKVLYIEEDSGLEGRIVNAQKSRGKHVLLKLSGINSREEAREMIGTELYLPEKEKIDLPEDTYFVHDIIGMDVFDENRDYIGSVKDVISAGAGDVYVVQDEKKETLIPANAQFIRNVNVEKGEMIVRLWEEL